MDGPVRSVCGLYRDGRWSAEWTVRSGLSVACTELEAQVSTAEDERRALVERCLDSERELERQKGGALELRRKLDDTTAALQELARENQLLQVRTAGRRRRRRRRRRRSLHGRVGNGRQQPAGRKILHDIDLVWTWNG